MQRILAAFHLDSPDSLKRAIATVLAGLAVLFINPLLLARGLSPVSDVALGAFATIATGFLLQSGLKSAKTGGRDAAVEVLQQLVQAGAPPAIPAPVPEPKPTAPGGA